MNVEERKTEDVIWSFTQEPKLKLNGWNSETIDPTPCYAHDMDVVRKCAAEVTELTWDIPDTTLFVSHFEGVSRTNGWTMNSVNYDGAYDEVEKRYTDTLYTIFFHGKRTPIHPAITRYLVAHEYGHIVQYWLEKKWDLDDDKLIDLYAKARNLERPKYYGPGTWHYTPGELFANDFRITLAKAEVEYWPHPGIERTPPHLEEWWKNTLQSSTKERWAELRDLGGDA